MFEQCYQQSAQEKRKISFKTERRLSETILSTKWQVVFSDHSVQFHDYYGDFQYKILPLITDFA